MPVTLSIQEWMEQLTALLNNPPQAIAGYIVLTIPDPDSPDAALLGHAINTDDENLIRQMLDEVWKSPLKKTTGE